MIVCPQTLIDAPIAAFGEALADAFTDAAMSPAKPQTSGDQVRQIPVDLIRPGRLQSRKHFDELALAELAGSIRELGIVQPLVLRGDARGYELLAGERRWRAAQLAGLHEVPALIRNDLNDDEAEVLGLVENLQREALSPLETALGLKALGERYQLTHEAMGARIGKSRVYITNFLRLLSLEASVQRWVDEGALSLGHAKALAGLNQRDQRALAAQAVAEQWSVRVLERRCAVQARTPADANTARPANPQLALQQLSTQIAEQLGYPVAVTMESDQRGDQHGELRIRFHSLDEFDGLMARLRVRLDG